MRYQVVFKRSAEKELDARPPPTRHRISARLLALENDPRPSGIKKLQGSDSYRLRVGDHRVLYAVDDRNGVVLIFATGHRREVYR